jgi:hypothetical protein
MGNINELLIGFGKSKQTNIATPNTAAGIWRMRKVNQTFANLKLNTEDDANELGSGNEFASNVFKTYWDFQTQFEKYCSAEFMTWVMVYSLGKTVKSGGTGNWIYTSNPLEPATDGVELPYFSHAEQIRPGATALMDRLAIGCAINDWTLSLKKGPGRASAKITVGVVGSGKHSIPSKIDLPAATAEKLLASAGLACSINGVDYVAAKDIEELTIGWNNNLKMDDGFYPGSGFQGTGTQVYIIRLGGTTGTANITAAGGLSLVVTFATDLTTSAGNFVTANSAAYSTAGIILTSVGSNLIFTDKVPGTGIVSPVIANATGDVAGKVYATQANGNAGISGAIRGRMEIGNSRTLSLSYIARFETSSLEEAKFLAGTEGTAVVSLTYDANNSWQATLQRIQFGSVDPDAADGTLVQKVDCKALWHTTNKLLTVISKCNIDGIGEAES